MRIPASSEHGWIVPVNPRIYATGSPCLCVAQIYVFEGAWLGLIDMSDDASQIVEVESSDLTPERGMYSVDVSSVQSSYQTEVRKHLTWLHTTHVI